MSDPYAPPSASARAEPLDIPDAADVRERHLRYESSLMALGWWFYFLGVLQAGFGLLCLVLAGLFLFGDLPPDEGLSPLALGAGLAVGAAMAIGFGGLSLYAGWGVRSCSPESRIPALLNAGIQVTWFPFGMIAGVAGLYLLLQPDSRVVLSHDYRDIREATPELKPPWHPLFWSLPISVIVTALLLAGFIALTVTLALSA